MTATPFVELSFHGPRFADAAMPLEALSELVAYRELLVAVAKSRYLLRHPERMRLPKGFEAGFRLSLTGVREGSTRPTVVRTYDEAAATDLVEAGEPDDFEEARNLVEAAISGAGNDAKMPKGFTADLLLKFSPFGRTLRDDETIRIGRAGEDPRTAYNRATRRQLLRLANRSYSDEIDLTGVASSADRDRERFELCTNDGHKFEVGSPPMLLPLAIKSLGARTPIRVRGTGQFDRDGVLKRVLFATDISPAEEDGEVGRASCSVPAGEQIDSLSVLAPGWFEGSGASFARTDLDWAKGLLESVIGECRLPTPYVYPTPEGEVRLEWPMRVAEVVATLHVAEPRTAELLLVRLDGDGAEDLRLDLSAPGQEVRFGAWLSERLRAEPRRRPGGRQRACCEGR